MTTRGAAKVAGCWQGRLGATLHGAILGIVSAASVLIALGLGALPATAQTVKLRLPGENRLHWRVTGQPIARYFHPVTETHPQDASCGIPSATTSTDWGCHCLGESHAGTDFGGTDPKGSTLLPVVAAAAGFVEDAVDRHEVYGNYVVLKHADGWLTLYAHLSSIQQYVYTKKYTREEVLCGERIGVQGSTGNADGTHLHFEYRSNGGYRPQQPGCQEASVDPFNIAGAPCMAGCSTAPHANMIERRSQWVDEGEYRTPGLSREQQRGLVPGVGCDEGSPPSDMTAMPSVLAPGANLVTIDVAPGFSAPPTVLVRDEGGSGESLLACTPILGSLTSQTCFVEMRNRLLNLFACYSGNCSPPVQLRPRGSTPTLTSVARADGLPNLEPIRSPGRQTITLKGSGFVEGVTRLHFERDSPAGTWRDRVPTFVNAHELRYDIGVGGPPEAPSTADWSVEACNEDDCSQPMSFRVECRPEFHTDSRTIGSLGGTVDVPIRAGLACPWAASVLHPASTWVQPLLGTASGNGDGVLRLVVSRNFGAKRTAEVALGPRRFRVEQAASNCSFTIVGDGSPLQFPAGGGSRWVDVVAAAGCTWAVSTSDRWISLAGGTSAAASQAGVESASTVPVEIHVEPATNAVARHGEVRVHDAAVAITQVAAPCTFAISPAEAILGAVNAARRISVDAHDPCSWAPTADPWIQILESDGRGSGGLTYRVEPYFEVGERVGSIRIGTATHVVRQRGLPTAIAPNPPNGSGGVPRQSPVVSWSFPGDLGAVEFAVRLGVTPRPPILAGYGSVQGTSHQFPITLGPGQTMYWSVSVRDEMGVIRDSPTWSFTTEQAVPDLQLSALQVVGPVAPGATVTVNATVENVGTYPSDARAVQFYLSRVAGARERALTLPNETWVDELEPGGLQVVSHAVVLDGLQSGVSHIDAWIDTTMSTDHGEASAGNDLASTAVSYTDAADPQVDYLRFGNIPGQYATGRPYKLAFRAIDDLGVAAFDLAFSTNGGLAWSPIVQGLPVAGAPSSLQTYEWVIPSGTPLGNAFHVRATARDQAGRTGSATAGPYVLVDGTRPVVRVLSPNGGEAWDIGSTRQVQWAVQGPNPLVSLRVYIDYGTISTLVADVPAPHPTSVPWTIPEWLTTTIGRIRVEAIDVNGGVGEDSSDGYFAVFDDSAPLPAPWRPIEQVTELSGASPAQVHSPRVAAGPSGDVHLVYLVSNPGLAPQLSGRFDEVRYQRLSGDTWSEPEIVVRHEENLEGNWDAASILAAPDITVGPDDQPHVTWQKHHATKEQRNANDVYHSTRTTGDWSPPFNLSSGVLADFTEQRIAWAPAASLPAPDSFLPAASAGGRLHVFNHSTPGVGTRTLVYDPVQDSWQAGASPIHPWGRQAVAMGGRIFLVSGATDRRIQILDGETWTAGAALPQSRSQFAIAAVGDRIHVLGGDSDVHHVYAPSTDTWSVAAPLPLSRPIAPIAAVVGTRIYLMGGDGQSRLARIDVYDDATGTWAIEQAGPLDDPAPSISDGAVALAHGGRILVVGGRKGNDHRRSVFEYAPGFRAWRLLAPMDGRRSFASAGIVGEELIVAGGQHEDGELATVEIGFVSIATEGASSGLPVTAVDSAGRLHVAWRDATWYRPEPGANRGVMRMHHRIRETNGTWSSVSSPFALAADGLGLVASEGGGVMLAFVGASGIQTSEWLAGAWSAPVVRSPALPNEGISVAAGPGNHRAIAWTDPDSSFLDSLLSGAAGWESLPRIPGSAPSAAVDSNGAAHLVWWLDDDVYYSTQSGGWTAPVVLTPTSHRPTAGDVDAVLTSADEVHVTWVTDVSGRSQVFHARTDTAISGDVHPPSVALTSPVAGTVLPMGAATTIRWQAEDDHGVTSVDLEWSLNDGQMWNSVVGGIPNPSELAWSVPLVSSETVRLRVTARDAAGNAAVAVSGRLSIADLTPPEVALIAPVGGASLLGGSEIPVTWEAKDAGEIADVSVEASRDGGASWFLIAADVADAGSIVWSVPNVATNAALVRVRARDAADLTGTAVTTPALAIEPAEEPRSAPHSPIPAQYAYGVASAAVQLAWEFDDAGQPGVVYEVSFAAAGEPATTTVVAAPMFEAGSLLPGTTYEWQVTAIMGDVTATGPAWAFTVASPPGTPTGLQASDGTGSDGVLVSWNTAPHATLYEVWRGSSDGASVSQSLMQLPMVAAPLVESTGTAMRDESAEAGVAYAYWIVARNSEGVSEPSLPDDGMRSEHVPSLDVSPGEVRLDVVGEVVEDLILVVSSPGHDSLGFSVTSTRPDWMIVGSQPRTTAGGLAEVAIEFDASGLTIGSHEADVEIHSTTAVNAPLSVRVVLDVRPPGPPVDDAVTIRLGSAVAHRNGGVVALAISLDPGSNCVTRAELDVEIDTQALTLAGVDSLDAECSVSIQVGGDQRLLIDVECPAGLNELRHVADLLLESAPATGASRVHSVSCMASGVTACAGGGTLDVACTSGAVHVGCLRGDLNADGMLTLADWILAVRRAELGDADAQDIECGDVGSVGACLDHDGVMAACAVHDGENTSADAELVRHLVQATARMACPDCGRLERPHARRRPADIAPDPVTDGAVTVGDIVRTRNWLLGQGEPSPEQLLRVDVAPTAGFDSGSLVVGGGDGLGEDDFAQLKKAALETESLTWQEWSIELRLDRPVSGVSALLARMRGWPDWCEPSTSAGDPCVVGTGQLDAAGDAWSLTCVMQGAASMQGAVATIRYRAPEAVHLELISVTSEMVSQSLEAVPGTMSLAVP